MQANQKTVMWTTILCSLVLLVSVIYIGSNMPETPVVPTEAGIITGVLAGLTMPVIDTTTQDRLCELTDGCEYWSGPSSALNALDVEDAFEDFEEALSELVNIDEDYMEYTYDLRDYQIRSYTDDDRDDENWEVQAFVKVKYWDSDDEDDDERIYLLITSTLDEGDYDELTIKEVSRSFEF